MDCDKDFNIQKQIDSWESKIKTQPSITESDAEELKIHLLDLIETLKDTGLDDQEAFLVASKRMGKKDDWGEEYRQENIPILQIRRSAIILAGVLFYFFFHFLIEIAGKTFFVILLNNDIGGYLALKWVSNYLIAICFLFVILLTTIYNSEKKVITFIEQVKFKPPHTILILLITIFLGIINTSLEPVAKNMMDQNYPLIGHYLEIFNYFDYTFPVILCLGFVWIYFKYYKKAKI
ncbi:MAG: hypothetical protein ACLFQA_03960 [Bacteroidales bacterium]